MKKVFFEYDELGQIIACHEIKEFVNDDEFKDLVKICKENKTEMVKRLAKREKALKEENERLKESIFSLKVACLELLGLTALSKEQVEESFAKEFGGK